MRQTIHPTAIVNKNAVIGENVEIGPYTIIGPQVEIKKGVQISSHVYIEGKSVIGENCKILNSSVIGTPPQDYKYKGENTGVSIGKNTIIREFVTINRSTNVNRPTTIGNNCMIMIYAHIAHDCQLGDNIIIANCVNIAGHVRIESYANIGGLTPVHQFVQIGCYSFIGGLSRVSKDIAPYTKGASVPYKTYGLNYIGLKRNNFSPENIKILKRLYKLFFHSNLNTYQAVEKIKQEFELTDEVKHFLDFVKKSKRGIAK